MRALASGSAGWSPTIASYSDHASASLAGVPMRHCAPLPHPPPSPAAPLSRALRALLATLALAACAPEPPPSSRMPRTPLLGAMHADPATALGDAAPGDPGPRP